MTPYCLSGSARILAASPARVVPTLLLRPELRIRKLLLAGDLLPPPPQSLGVCHGAGLLKRRAAHF
jgi:hypothetical protein